MTADPFDLLPFPPPEMPNGDARRAALLEWVAIHQDRAEECLENVDYAQGESHRADAPEIAARWARDARWEQHMSEMHMLAVDSCRAVLDKLDS